MVERELPKSIVHVLETKYEELRRDWHRQRVRWRVKDNQTGDGGEHTAILRETIEKSLQGAHSARLREQLLLEAARRGYVPIVRELLCPSGKDRGIQPVSFSVSRMIRKIPFFTWQFSQVK